MNYLLLRTPLGLRYSRKIAEELRRFGNRVYIYKCSSINLAFERHPEWNPGNLIIHSRAADPNAYWIKKLIELEKDGFIVVNKPSVLKLTSDKYKSVKFLEEKGFRMPKTFLLKRGEKLSKEILDQIDTEYIIIKPRYSQGGGRFVEKIHKNFVDDEAILRATMAYSCSSVIQEFIPYEEIYRVFVINGNSLPILTMDSPDDTNWKVSVCLNPWQIPIKFPEINSSLFATVRNYGEDIQRKIEGEINFIDVFNVGGRIILSEINTACSLILHQRLLNYNIAKEIANYLIQVKDKIE